MQLKILLTGGNGMLADALCPELKKKGYRVISTDISNSKDIIKLDVRDKKEVLKTFRRFNPDIVYHLAAETDVDKCQIEPKIAYETNAQGTENVATACKELDVTLVYISTGAVFDGEKLSGYTEEDTPNPLNEYAKSKLQGEIFIRSILKKFYIVRAGWMIGGFNKDKKFVWKIINLLKTEKEISVVTDKIGSPTFTKDFAKGVTHIVSTCKYGLYHCVNEGVCSRFDIATKIVEFLNRKDVVLKPVTSDAFPLPAPRGKSEVLLNWRLKLLGLNLMRKWEDALREYINEFRSNEGIIS